LVFYIRFQYLEKDSDLLFVGELGENQMKKLNWAISFDSIRLNLS